jgi:[protein-PII] uridylyltransferase
MAFLPVIEDVFLPKPALAHQLKTEIAVLLKKGQGRLWQEYILNDREERHLRYGDSAFFLEPHLKEGLGGLRDIHVVQWIGKALYEAQDLYALEKLGLLSWGDREGLNQSHKFILRLRNQLHYLAGRKTDQLSFEFQEAMAGWAGIHSQEDILPVEVFMRPKRGKDGGRYWKPEFFSKGAGSIWNRPR